MTKAFRHGDICFVKIDKLPKGLEESKSKEIVKGSHNNSHSFDGGKLYPKSDGQIIGYFRASNTTLLHPDHGRGKGQNKKAILPDGIYEVRKQVEFTPQGLIPIVD